MTQLRIRQKPTTAHRLLIAPMVAVLAIGLATSWWLDSGRVPPTEIVSGMGPAARASWQSLHRALLAHRTFEVAGRRWVLAEHPPVAIADAAEWVGVTEMNGERFVANRVRGLPALSGTAHAFDRLFLDTGSGQVLALRWRDLPGRTP